jgi:hypothetical protein
MHKAFGAHSAQQSAPGRWSDPDRSRTPMGIRLTEISGFGALWALFPFLADLTCGPER